MLADIAGDAPPVLVDAPVGCGIVPHAGWMYSGALAWQVIRWLGTRFSPETVVLLGNDHRGQCRGPTVQADGAWESPLGTARVDAALASSLLNAHPSFRSDARPHGGEHSLEVQLPMVQAACPNAAIVPVLVPPGPDVVDCGVAVARVLAEGGSRAVVLGTTDLTHYGPSYRFEPRGQGAAAVRWVTEENDRAMIDLLLALDAEAVTAASATRQNACSPGAVAMTLAVARALGARRGTLVGYTTSHAVSPGTSFVGYAGVAF